jgi:hypothetical protein
MRLSGCCVRSGLRMPSVSSKGFLAKKVTELFSFNMNRIPVNIFWAADPDPNYFLANGRNFGNIGQY